MRYLQEALAWLGDGSNWTGTTGVGRLLWQHLWYSLLALALAALVAIPLGWWVGHRRRGRGLAVGLSGAARALPTLGLVTLFGLMLGIGLRAPILALVVLAVPSVLAAAYGSVEAVDPGVVDGARASGLNEWQVLGRVEVPLGLPVLVGGLRSAMLQVVSTATLAAYVGAGGLGRLLFLGLKTQQYHLMLAASLLVIALAIGSELFFVIVQRLVTPASANRKE